MPLANLQAFIKRHGTALLALGAMTSIYFCSYFQRVAVPGTIFDELQIAFAASAGAIAALSSIFLYIYGSVQIGVGLMADRWGGARTMVLSGALMGLGSLWFPLAGSLPFVFASRALVGLGAAGIYISLAKEIDRLFAPRHFAILLSLTLMFGYAGGLAGTFPAERLTALLGWRPAFLLFGAAGAGAWLVMVCILRRTGHLRPPAGGGRPDPLHLKDILLNRRSYPVLMTSSLNFTVYFIWLAVFGKKMLSDVCGISSAAAAQVTFLMMLTTMLGLSLSGFVSRLIGNRRKPIILAGLLLTLTAVSLMAANVTRHPDYHLLLLGFLLLGLAAISQPMGICTMKELNPERAAGAAIGVLNSGAYLAVALGANVAGALMDGYLGQTVATATARVYPPAAYAAILVFSLILEAGAILSALCIRETHGACVFQARRSEPHASG